MFFLVNGMFKVEALCYVKSTDLNRFYYFNISTYEAETEVFIKAFEMGNEKE